MLCNQYRIIIKLPPIYVRNSKSVRRLDLVVILMIAGTGECVTLPRILTYQWRPRTHRGFSTAAMEAAT